MQDRRGHWPRLSCITPSIISIINAMHNHSATTIHTMRRYLAALLLMGLVLVVASFIVLWASPEYFLVAMPLLVIYFTVITCVQHYIVLRAMSRSPKTFVQVFLGSTIATLMLHLILIATYLIGRGIHPKLFLIAFCIGYVCYLAFETIALVRYVDSVKKRNTQQQPPLPSDAPSTSQQ